MDDDMKLRIFRSIMYIQEPKVVAFGKFVITGKSTKADAEISEILEKGKRNENILNDLKRMMNDERNFIVTDVI